MGRAFGQFFEHAAAVAEAERQRDGEGEGDAQAEVDDQRGDRHGGDDA